MMLSRGKGCGAGLAAVLIVAAGAAQAAPQSGSAAVVVERQQLPAEMMAATERAVLVVLSNHGVVSWDPAADFHVGAHWLYPDGRVASWDGPRTDLPRAVPPGATVTLDVRLLPPDAPGDYLVQWDVVQEHVAWLSQRTPSPQTFPVRVTPWRASHSFAVLASDLPHRLAAGERRSVRLRLANRGTVTWDPAERFNVSYHWLAADGSPLTWEGERTMVPGRVPPGATTDVTVRLLAPDEPGRYLLQWDMVQEDVTWFSQRDRSSPPRIAVRVTRPPPLAVLATVAAGVLAVLAWAAVARNASGWPLGLLAVADLAWLAVSLVVKQPVVLHVARRAGEPGQTVLVVAGVALLLLLLLALPRRLRPLAAWIMAAGAGVVLLSDVVYLSYFGDVLSLAALGGAGQVPQVRDSIGHLLAARDVWLLADLLPGLALVLAVRRLAGRAGRRPPRLVAAALVPVLALGAVVAVRQLRSAPERLGQMFENLAVVQEVGLYNYHLVDAVNQLAASFLRPSLSPAQRAGVEAWIAERAPLRAGVGPRFAAARGRNLVMIQVESLQRFVIGLEVEGQEITPFLDHWLATGLWFPHVTDQTDEGRTSDGELTTQASLLPLAHGAAVFRYPTNHYAAVARVLAAHGYHTLSAVPFAGSFWNRRLTHPAWGFGTNLFDDAFAPGERIGWGLNDADFLDQMAARLQAEPEPFCAWLITLSLHYPFEGFPDRHKELRLGPWEGTEFGNYLHTMHFFDKALAAFVAELGRTGLAGRSVIALWGDHDAGFGWSPRLEPVLGIRHHEADWILEDRVPLVVVAPGEPGLAGEMDVQAGQTDVAPTLLALLGVDPAPYAFVGRNLLGEPGDGPVVRPGGQWVDGRHLYVSRGSGFADGVCYDLVTRAPESLEACRDGDAAAGREREAAHLLLAYDLQEQLSRGPLAGGSE